MLYQLKIRKKEIVILSLIIIFALVSTYKIYDKFKDYSNVKYDSDTLDVTFHEKSGNKVDILKVTGVTDSVGLSSKSYKFTIKNNTNANVKYSINIDNNLEAIKIDKCKDKQIPKNIIRFSINKDKEEKNIYNLSDLINGHVLTRIIKAKSTEEYTMRFWVSNKANVTDSKLHYHGLINVVDEGNQVAVSIS